MKKLDPVKLELIRTAAMQTQGKSGKALVPVMMTLITGANKKGIQFTQEEITLILDLLKEGKSQEERMQIDRMVQMVQMMQKNGGPPGKK
ncbi:MAG: hypothetical protein ACI4F1_09215 [Bariatricus sp.]